MLRLSIFLLALLLATPSHAARCGGDFYTFVSSISAEAAAAGISQSVLAFDRRQHGTFNKTFEQYVSTRVGPGRINGDRAVLARHAALLSRIKLQAMPA